MKHARVDAEIPDIGGEIRIDAPLSGWTCALHEVPDAVFADGMMGEGVAIDPLDGVVRAPCDARVIGVAPTRHSVTLELANGAQILIHVGLDTVALGGEGLVAHVAVGDDVSGGAPLIGFDLDLVARRAKSVVTPIVVVNEGYELRIVAIDRLVEAGELLFTVSRTQSERTAKPSNTDKAATAELVVRYGNGVHARPAARIAAALKPFVAEVSFEAHDKSVNAKSVVALLGLGLRQGDRIAITARGPDADRALVAVTAVMEDSAGEDEPALRPPLPAGALVAAGTILQGCRASPGLAVGPLFQLRVADIDVPRAGRGMVFELAALDAALAEIAADPARMSNGLGAEIAAAHAALLDDPELIAAARRGIEAGQGAAFAWRRATRAAADAIRATGDRLLIERIADLVDIERQVVARLMGGDVSAPVVPEGAILVADELLPSQFMALDAARLAGICTAGGGPTSHVAILAGSAGVPMLVAVGADVLAVPDGHVAVLDASAGTIDTEPNPATLVAARDRVGSYASARAAAAAAAHEPCVTADGVRIEIFANLGSIADARAAVIAGAEGCGLLRTEFLFLDRATAPDEEEQRAAYAAVADALGDRPVIVRTLDIGGDKPVAYLPMAREHNPALGLRGVRLSLARPDLLAEQLRAILRSIPGPRCRIMLPMIVEVDELRRVRFILDEARRTVGRGDPVALGVMIETPAAAMLADGIAAEADFLSVGSNDLTQYALAADRGNPALAARIDPLHPAVLRLIAAAAAGAKMHGKWIGVCGGVASDPSTAAVLLGLGLTELSATPAAIPGLKAAVRGLRLDACRALALRALAATSAAEVRALLEQVR